MVEGLAWAWLASPAGTGEILRPTGAWSTSLTGSEVRHIEVHRDRQSGRVNDDDGI